MKTPSLYGEDLAAIQAAGFGDHARNSSAGLLAYLRSAGLAGQRVIDLGCGAGEWLAALTTAGHEAIGWEPSPYLAALARKRAPDAQVHDGGIEDADLAGACAVTAIGEVFNYLPPQGRGTGLTRRLRRIGAALPRGGLLLFDLIVSGRPSLNRRGWTAGDGWLVAVDMEDAGDYGERGITTFRCVDSDEVGWRRSDEVHRIRIPTRSEVVEALRESGFVVRTARHWGDHALLPRRCAFIARRR